MNKQDLNIKELIRIFDKSGMTKLKITEGDFCIDMRKDASSQTFINEMPQIVSSAAHQTATVKIQEESAESQKSSLPTFKSPMVGTFYKAPSPGAEAFVKIGSVVKKGQPIAIVEAMKIMNEIDAEFDCRIVDILVEDGQPVEFDMPLFSVEKL
ncbi:MAG: acetyl-CoA carboxylase biotin carboxyl carrier protein [Campylobacteraceae bacterium]|jgi:acetyl-CoA carboxylase biotin carboxyl carrier protein|nr:acetyl-CoA carboxylase biotin carboxyl carrier protein [Campylobacteraceae bacterium]